MNAKQQKQPCLAIVPISPVETCKAPQREKTHKLSTYAPPVNSIMVGNIQYLVGKTSCHGMKGASDITQIRMGYRDFKRMQHNTFKPKPATNIIHLPAPAKVITSYDNHPLLDGRFIPIPGFSQKCLAMSIFDKFDEDGNLDDTWVELFTIKHKPMTIYRKLSQIQEQAS